LARFTVASSAAGSWGSEGTSEIDSVPTAQAFRLFLSMGLVHRRVVDNFPVLDHVPLEALHIYAQGRQRGEENDILDANLFAFVMLRLSWVRNRSKFNEVALPGMVKRVQPALV